MEAFLMTTRGSKKFEYTDGLDESSSSKVGFISTPRSGVAIGMIAVCVVAILAALIF